MGGGIFIVRGEDELIAMVEEEYETEAVFQELLARFPSLLAGDQMNPSQQEWLLVQREAKLPTDEDSGGRWSIDHLFLDQHGVPTLVEVKRSSDTRIRREVVGQMLDYAANAVVYWPVERLRATFEASVGADERLRAFLRAEMDPDAFWAQVGTNLFAGKVRLVFVADEIPPELRRIVEFLNTQMNPAEVIAVEIKRYGGNGLRTLVSRLIGQTAEAQRRKGRSEGREWDEATFLEELERRKNSQEADVARAILEWSRSHGLRLTPARGDRGGFRIEVAVGNDSHNPFVVRITSRIVVRFNEIARMPPFADKAKRMQLLQRLNEVTGIDFPDDAVDVRARIPLDALTDPRRLDALLDAFASFVAEVRSAPASRTI